MEQSTNDREDLTQKARSRGKAIRHTVVNKTGYEPADLLEAPVRPPELQNTRKSLSVRQYAFIAGGVLAAVVGLIIWLAALAWLGFILMFVGVVLIALAVLVRI